MREGMFFYYASCTYVNTKLFFVVHLFVLLLCYCFDYNLLMCALMSRAMGQFDTVYRGKVQSRSRLAKTLNAQ